MSSSKKRPRRVVEKQLKRIRRICHAYPETIERLSHGAPTFFAKKKVFVMFVDDHHNDCHLSVWLPAPPGVQEMLIEASPKKYYRPPYVGVSGWIGVELENIDDKELESHIRESWRLVAPKRLIKEFEQESGS